MVLALALFVVVSSPPRFWRTDQRTQQGRSTRGLKQASASAVAGFTPLFSFAPSNAAGVGSDCACAAVTDASGAVSLSFTRSSSALCIPASGNFAECSSNQPRIQNGAFLREAAATNYVLRNEELDNAAWYKLGAGGSAPTVTAGFADPMGGTTAERVQIDACPSGGNYSIVGQNFSINRSSASVWSKANGADCQFAQVLLGSGAPHVMTVCNATSSWTKCETHSSATVNTELDLGCWNHPSVSGATNTGVCDVLIWRPQVEETPIGSGGYTTSAIKTVAASATRAADSQLTGTLASTLASGAFCAGATFKRSDSVNFSGTLFTLTDSTTTAGPTSNTVFQTVANGSTQNATVSALGTSEKRFLWEGSAGSLSGVTISPVATATNSSTNTAISIGHANGLTSRVVLGVSGCE